MKRLILIVSISLFIVLGWYLLSDRLTPYTSNAVVKAIVTPIVPQVSGVVTNIPVKNGTIVNTGDLLVQIEKDAYEIARDKAEAEVQQALEDAGAGSASIKAAQANVSKAEAELENVRTQTARIFQLEQDDLISKADSDNARKELVEAKSGLDNAKAELEKAKQKLGATGRDNSGVQRALAELAKAELDVNRTEIVAPTRGGITNLVVSPGAYAVAGTPLLTFVDIGQVWVEAYLTENNLGYVRVGNVVEVTLDIHPGRIFQGRVASFSSAASDETDSKPGSLSSAPKQSGWLREPKRIPVRIVLTGYDIGNPDDDVRFQINGQADVIVYTGKNPILNIIGKALIRVAAVLSYAY